MGAFEAVAGGTPADKMRAAARWAHPPISRFRVGAVGQADDGTWIPGFNLEFAGRPLDFTVHAEQAVAALAHRRGLRLERLWVSAAPCGHCRQFLWEHHPELEIRVPGWPAPRTPAALLPEPWPLGRSPLPRWACHAGGPGLSAPWVDVIERVATEPSPPVDLQIPARPPVERGVEERSTTVVWSDGSREPIRSWSPPGPPRRAEWVPPEAAALALWMHTGRGVAAFEGPAPTGSSRQLLLELPESPPLFTEAGRLTEPLPLPFGPDALGIAQRPDPSPIRGLRADLESRARAAAAASWAPYTRCRSGCAVRMRGGDVVTGRVVESVAFNPTLTAPAAALAAAQGLGYGSDAVEEIVLAEAKDRSVRVLDAVRRWFPQASVRRVDP